MVSLSAIKKILSPWRTFLRMCYNLFATVEWDRHCVAATIQTGLFAFSASVTTRKCKNLQLLCCVEERCGCKIAPSYARTYQFIYAAAKSGQWVASCSASVHEDCQLFWELYHCSFLAVRNIIFTISSLPAQLLHTGVWSWLEILNTIHCPDNKYTEWKRYHWFVFIYSKHRRSAGGSSEAQERA